MFYLSYDKIGLPNLTDDSCLGAIVFSNELREDWETAGTSAPWNGI